MKSAAQDLETQANAATDPAAFAKQYPHAAIASGNGKRVTEMDALVAYLQVLGTMVNFADTSEESLQQ